MKPLLSADQQHDLILNSFQRLQYALMLERIPHKDTLYLRPMTDTTTMRRCMNELINNYPLALNKPFNVEEWKAIYDAHIERTKENDKESMK